MNSEEERDILLIYIKKKKNKTTPDLFKIYSNNPKSGEIPSITLEFITLNALENTIIPHYFQYQGRTSRRNTEGIRCLICIKK